MKKTGLNGYVYDLSVYHDAIAADDILYIRKYLMKKMGWYKTVEFVKQMFASAMMFFCCNILNVNSLKCVSLNNQEIKVRQEIVNINSTEPMFYSYSIKINKCSGSCNNINDPYANLCVPDVVKHKCQSI